MISLKNELNQGNQELKELIAFLSVILLTSLIFSFALFGIRGARVVLGVIFISMPFYLILNNFQLDKGEKFVFSILLGLTIFPSLAYLLGLFVPFRIAIAVVFVALIGVMFGIKACYSKM